MNIEDKIQKYIRESEYGNFKKIRSKGKAKKQFKSTKIICMECGNKFSKKLHPNTREVKCSNCGGFDTEIV